MPTYEYLCKSCDHEFEREQRITDPKVRTCPKCKKRRVERLISQTSFVLRGGGWYNDLYSSDEIEKIFSEVVSFWVDPEKCKACMICARKCPVDGILGGKSQIHVIDQELCIRCGTCFDACPQKFDAVCKITGQAVPPPIPEDERIIERKAKEAG